jgi:hypothetical protein
MIQTVQFSKRAMLVTAGNRITNIVMRLMISNIISKEDHPTSWFLLPPAAAPSID